MERALAGLAAIGDYQAVEFLVKAGASPNALTPDGSAMRQFWGSPRLEHGNFALTWRALNAGEIKPCWKTWLENQPVARSRTPEILRSLMGEPNLPSGEAALAFLTVLVKHDLSPQSLAMFDCIPSFRWWRENGQIELAQEADARLLYAWLSTVGPNIDHSFWFNELVPDGNVPPLNGWGCPEEEPTWAHVLARSPSFSKMPESIIKALLAPEHKPWVLDGCGRTPAQVAWEKCERTGLTRVAEKDVNHQCGLLKSYSAAFHLEEALPPADPEPEVASKPRPRL